MFQNRAAHGGRQGLRRVGGSCGSLGAFGLAFFALFARAAGFLALGSRSGAFLDHGDDRVHLDRVADRNLELFDDTGNGGGGLHRDLVGLEADDRLVRRDRVADILEQFADSRFGDRFTQRGNFDFGGHNVWLLRPYGISCSRCGPWAWSRHSVRARC